jgi:LysM repeat protein
MAAAICLSPQALAETPATQVTAHHGAALGAASRPDVQPGQLMADLVGAKQRSPASPADPVRYSVRSGDSLSSIAGRFYQNPDAWPVLYWANHGQVRWANTIVAGQVLRVPAKPARIPSPPSQLGPPVSVAAAAQESLSYAPAHAAPVTTGTYSGGYPGGSFGACVVARESGGNAQAMNGTGHYGLYQFSASTWAAYGGNPASFGNASVAEQNRVFANALAAGGQSNWSSYDGC